MESALPQNWLALAAVVFMLGAKHGMDPDHLATIDGLTRFNAQNRPSLARWSGCLFSLGHGLVVTLVSGVVAAMTTEWTAPSWLERTGAAVSVAFLVALGSANLLAAVRTRNEVVRLTGFKARWLGRLAQTSHPVVIASIGAAFAVSFDTWSQAALFSVTAAHLSGWEFAVVLGLVFTAGMMAADGLNGLWVARMVRRADRRAVIASRVMSAAIGLLSLAIACLGISRLALPGLAAAVEDSGLLLGASVIAALAAAYFLAMRLTRPQGAAR